MFVWYPDFETVSVYVDTDNPLKNACPHADESAVRFPGLVRVTVAPESGAFAAVTSTRSEFDVFGKSVMVRV